MGADTGRGTDSKPGGSDGGTDKILLLGGSSSTTESFRGACTAAGDWIGAGPEAKTLPSWANGGTSKTENTTALDLTQLLLTFRPKRFNSKTYQFLFLQLNLSHEKTKNEDISQINVLLGKLFYSNELMKVMLHTLSHDAS